MVRPVRILRRHLPPRTEDSRRAIAEILLRWATPDLDSGESVGHT